VMIIEAGSAKSWDFCTLLRSDAWINRILNKGDDRLDVCGYRYVNSLCWCHRVCWREKRRGI
jgi:hypothetical protein